jgi:hypothetical protein
MLSEAQTVRGRPERVFAMCLTLRRTIFKFFGTKPVSYKKSFSNQKCILANYSKISKINYCRHFDFTNRCTLQQTLGHIKPFSKLWDLSSPTPSFRT